MLALGVRGAGFDPSTAINVALRQVSWVTYEVLTTSQHLMCSLDKDIPSVVCDHIQR